MNVRVYDVMICMIRCMLGFVMYDKHDKCMARDV